jgi:hypothetical protein
LVFGVLETLCPLDWVEVFRVHCELKAVCSESPRDAAPHASSE